MQAFQTREEMRKAGIAADPVTYEALLEVAAVAGDWQSAEAVIRELLASCDGGGGKDPVQKESGSGSRRAREEGNEEGDQEGVNSGGMKADSRSVFVKVTHKEGKERGAASAGAAQNGTDVAAHAGAEAGVDLGADTFASPGDWTERRKRWRRQQLASGVQATPQVFQLLMEAYSRAGEWERALACLDDMWSSAHAHMAPRRERGFSAGAEFPPDATCFGWAIQARCLLGSLPTRDQSCRSRSMPASIHPFMPFIPRLSLASLTIPVVDMYHGRYFVIMVFLGFVGTTW